jgi:hypothetical protein
MARLGPAKSQVLLLRSFHIPGKNHDALLALLELWNPMESYGIRSGSVWKWDFKNHGRPQKVAMNGEVMINHG